MRIDLVTLLVLGTLAACGGASSDRDQAQRHEPACLASSCTSTGGASSGGEGGATSGNEGGAATGGEGAAPWCPVESPYPPPPPGANPILCQGIIEGLTCTLEGAVCPAMRCGTAGAGVRHCGCQDGIWDCTDCDLTIAAWWSENLWNEAEPCVAGVADEVACETEQQVCASTNSEACVCYVDYVDEDTQALFWDCGTVEACAP